MLRQTAKSICIAFVFIITMFFGSTFSAYTQTNNSTPKINRYPNELKGYEFYQNEKVKQLIPAVSTSGDIRRIFGENCSSMCDYDEDWKISFSYFGGGWKESNYESDNLNWIEYKYPYEIVGRLSTIEFIPKKSFDFSHVIEECCLVDIEGNSTASRSKFQQEFSWGVGGQDHPSISWISFNDRYGLTYRICNNDKNKANCRKGDLWSIEYKISDEENERIRKQSTIKN